MLDSLRTRWALRNCARVGRGVEVRGRVHVHGGGVIELGDGVVLDASRAPIELKVGRGARLTLGAGCVLEGGASLEAENRIALGPRVRVRAFAKLLDSHFHRVDDHGQRPPPGEVRVEEDADIGAHAILLPGAHLGRGVTVAERSVVSRRVPDGASVIGNPARILLGKASARP